MFSNHTVYHEILQWSWIKTKICGSHSNPKPSFCGVSPTPNPPAPTPSSCPSSELDVQISVTTDNYPEEISWVLEDASGNEVSKSESFGSDYTTYQRDLCLDSNTCYKFTMKDSYGDGITGDGDFTLNVNGQVLSSNPNGGFSSKETEFGDCSVAITPPTATPTTAPTATPTTPSCGANELEVNISITTDSYPDETSWVLTDSNGGEINSPTFTSISTTYEESLCVDALICHTFTIKDSYGDGINTGGTFTLTVNGEQILADKTSGWYSMDAEFGQCDIAVTSQPTVSPTSSPTFSPTTSPTPEPTSSPTISPTPEPTSSPTTSPTPEPTSSPTTSPTDPITADPTSSPITSPTGSPQSCLSDQIEVTVSVLTDNYPSELSWKLLSSNGVSFESDPFAKKVTLYEEILCVEVDLCHSFTINDSYGDGILSQGDFKLKVDGIVILSDSTEGWKKLEAEFGQCDATSTSAPTEVPTKSPTRSPTPGPTSSPILSSTLSPTASGTSDGSCGPNDLEVDISVTTDYFPEEVSWSLNAGNGESYDSEPFKDRSTTYESNICVDASACYKFTMKDSYGDGITGDGDFTFSVDGNVLLSDTTAGWSELDVEFGECETSSNNGCGANELDVAISITTDSYPQEISWVLTDSNGGEIKSPAFTSASTTYTESLCVDASICNTFTINDTYGDGISTGGTFTLTVDGDQILADKATGWYSLDADFGSC